MRSLCVLSLTTGTSLTADTFAAIAAFPLLSELEIHAGHIDAEELADAMVVRSTPLFPSLQKLHVRAHAQLVEFLLQIMSSKDFRYLNIEAEQPTQAPSSWSSALSLIPVKASNTLLEFRMEHHTDIDIDVDSNFNSSPAHANSSIPNGRFTITNIRPLAQLPHLRRFVLDTVFPPDLCDADIEEIAKWWPHVEHFDLGGLLSHVDCFGRPWKLRATINCLEFLARGCPRLDTLIINLDVTCTNETNNKAAQIPPLPQHPLRRLTVGSMVAPVPLHWSPHLRRVFPALSDIGGIPTYEAIWGTVRTMLFDLHPPSKYPGQITLDSTDDNAQDGKEFHRALHDHSFVH